MGSIRFDGVRFTAYTMDHAPRHVHAFYAEIEVIVDLRPDGKGLTRRQNGRHPARQRQQVQCAARAHDRSRAF
jgi:hypothetical protein